MRFALRFSCLLPLLFFFFPRFISPDERLRQQEEKVRLLEQEKAVASCANALTALRRHLNRPPSLFDRYEAIELLESLVRLARTQPTIRPKNIRER